MDFEFNDKGDGTEFKVFTAVALLSTERSLSFHSDGERLFDLIKTIITGGKSKFFSLIQMSNDNSIECNERLQVDNFQNNKEKMKAMNIVKM